MNKYFVKHQRVWKDSVVVDEVSDGEDSDEEDSTDDAEPASNGARRGCFIASDTNTLMKFYNSIDPIVQASVEQFIERFRHFDMISTFDDYTTVEYRDGSFRREAPEKLSLEHGDAALCTLVAIVLLTDTDGKDLCFPLQTDADGQPMYLEANAGDVFVWPACALHPYEVMNRDTRKVFRYVQVNIT